MCVCEHAALPIHCTFGFRMSLIEISYCTRKCDMATVYKMCVILVYTFCCSDTLSHLGSESESLKSATAQESMIWLSIYSLSKIKNPFTCGILVYYCLLSDRIFTMEKTACCWKFLDSSTRAEQKTRASGGRLGIRDGLKRANLILCFAGVVLLSAGLAVIPAALRVDNETQWFYLAIVVLVSGCPCALILSTPVANFCALTKAATTGLLVKGGEYLEILAKVKTVAFDKTGTITRGEFVVTDFQCLRDDISFNTLLYW